MKFLFTLLLSSILLSACSTSLAQNLEDEVELDYSYTLAFPLECISKKRFMEILPEGFYPLFEFAPNEKLTKERSSAFLFINDDNEFFITLPADDSSDICFAQSGVISKYNIKALQKIILKDSI